MIKIWTDRYERTIRKSLIVNPKISLVMTKALTRESNLLGEKKNIVKLSAVKEAVRFHYRQNSRPKKIPITVELSTK